MRAEFVRVLRRISRRLQRLSHRSAAGALHETRILIKLLRALLWLVKPSLPPKMAAAAKKELHKAAQLLSDARDARVAKSILENLEKKARLRRETRAVKAALARLARENPPAEEIHPLLRHAIAMVRKIIMRLERNIAPEAEPPGRRLQKAFRQTARAAQAARKERSAVRYHEWRKKTKRLLYLLQILEPEPGRKTARQIEGIDRLQHELGDHQDSVVLEQKLRKRFPSHRSGVRPLLGLLRRRKRRLRKKARKLAHGL